MGQAAAYLRVSTKDQSVSMQRQIITEYCAKNSIQISNEYADEGVSGKTMARPMFEKMMRNIREGRHDMVIVYSLDRLGRSLAGLLQLFEEFRNRKVKLRSIRDGICTDEDNPMSRAFMALISTFAQLERELIVSRVKAGIDRARRDGKVLGRPVGKKDKSKRSVSGYRLRYAGRSKDERRLGKRKSRSTMNDSNGDIAGGQSSNTRQNSLTRIS